MAGDGCPYGRRVSTRAGSTPLTPLLTVGITTKNRPDALRACVQSLEAIAHLAPEVLVFDDASDVPAHEQLAGTHTPVRVLTDPSAPGYIVGRNRLVREATGTFVLLMDDDARLLGAAAVESALAVLHADPKVGAVGFAQAESDGRPWPATMQPSTAQLPTIVASFIGFAHLVRRTVFLELSGYREAFQYFGEEKDFCLRLIEAGYQTVYLPDALVAHVIHAASRNHRRYLRLVARNDCLNTLYNDPLGRVLWILPARYALYFRMRRSWKIRDPWGGAWLARDILRKIPGAWKQRRPVSQTTLARWRALRAQQLPYSPPSRPADRPSDR
jgi:GT2 family glycosyltransferase